MVSGDYLINDFAACVGNEDIADAIDGNSQWVVKSAGQDNLRAAIGGHFLQIVVPPVGDEHIPRRLRRLQWALPTRYPMDDDWVFASPAKKGTQDIYQQAVSEEKRAAQNLVFRGLLSEEKRAAQNLVFRGLLEGGSTQHPSAPSEAT